MDLPLGRTVEYRDTLDPTLLFAIPRENGRQRRSIDTSQFEGVDVWRSFELSWLDLMGKPRVGIVEISYSAHSPNIIESKSMKLFLGSFNNHVFESPVAVQDTIERELSRCSGAHASAAIALPQSWGEYGVSLPPGETIDEGSYIEGNGALRAGEESANECISSNLLRSLCPVTGQPDWGTLVIDYKGKKLSHESLLTYLVKHRSFQGFHEECCERLFAEVCEVVQPLSLTVACFYTRRGGIDINPIRWLKGTSPSLRALRLTRQ